MHLSLLAALVVASVLATAALGKLTDRPAAQRAFRDLALPPAAAVLLPVAELVTATLLLVVPPVGGPVAVALFVGFTAFVTVRRRSGSNAPCNCFGSTDPEPVGGTRPLVRNGALIALSVAASWTDRPSPEVAAALLTAAVAGAFLANQPRVRRMAAPRSTSTRGQ